ncbi:MAG: hypothetical protein KDB60_15220 [Propionibacteriaceae bacterium]|nr:hypothetical protein [Propionibacteriaceae bacterium]
MLAQQSAHLVATTLAIRDAAPHADQPQLTDALNTAGRNLRDGARPWRQLTTLNRPQHVTINVSRHLALTLERTAAALPDLTHDETSDLLTEAHRGLTHASVLMDRTATLPDRLVRSGLLFTAARRVTHNVEHLTAAIRGGYVPVQVRDVPDLVPTWRRAVVSLDWAVVAERTTDHSTQPRQHSVISIHR